MIINIADVWDDVSLKHHEFLESKIADGLQMLSDSFIDEAIKNFIFNNRHAIINGAPKDLKVCILDYEKRFVNKTLNVFVRQRLKEIFDFEYFSKKNKKKWNAYDLCLLARYKVCCYCHMVSTGAALPNRKGKGYRPPIDHYYTKSDYPFLSLTLSNFIPCCEKCNGSQMKHSIDFAKVKHLNPLVDAESIEFELQSIQLDNDFAESLTLQKEPEKYALKVKVKRNISASNNSIKTFQLISRYDNYSTRAYYLAKRIRGFYARKKSVDKNLDFEVDLTDLLEFEPNNYKNIEFGKVRVCIAKQFGAIII